MTSRGGPGGFLRNWREAEGGGVRKAWLAARNLGRRVVRLQVCCGRPGEPGC